MAVIAIGLALGGCSSDTDATWHDGASPEGGGVGEASTDTAGRSDSSAADHKSGADALTATDLPAEWPAMVPVPAGATLIEAQPASSDNNGEFYLYLQVEGDLEDVVAELAAKLDEVGSGQPDVDLSEASGRLRATGKGYDVLVEVRVDDDNINVLDVSYLVSPVS